MSNQMITENNDSPDIETKIIEAANNVFLKYGVDKSTMGQIADEAGISRTSLNYYFRGKRNLLQKVIISLENKIVPTISILINDDKLSAIDKIESFVDEYINLIIKYPMIPTFMVSELLREPNWIFEFIRQNNLNIEKISLQINDEIAQGELIPFKFEDLFVNVISLCAFPLVAKPLLMEFFFDQNEEKLAQFMVSRKNEVKRILRKWLKPD